MTIKAVRLPSLCDKRDMAKACTDRGFGSPTLFPPVSLNTCTARQLTIIAVNYLFNVYESFLLASLEPIPRLLHIYL